jgi:hypothetical protein
MPKRKRKQADGKGDDDRARLQGLDERAPGEKDADSDAEMALALALSLEAKPPLDHSDVAARKPGPDAAAQQSVKGKGGVRKKGRSEQSALPETPAEMRACFRQLSGATGGSVITERSISHVSESACSRRSCCRVRALPAQPNVETVAFCRLAQFKKPMKRQRCLCGLIFRLQLAEALGVEVNATDMMTLAKKSAPSAGNTSGITFEQFELLMQWLHAA